MMVVAGFFTLCAVLSLFLLKRVSGGCWANSSRRKQTALSCLRLGDAHPWRQLGYPLLGPGGPVTVLTKFLGGRLGRSPARTSHCSLFPQVHSLYRRTGASFQQAQEEFSQGIFSNRTFRSAASSAARGAFQGN